MEKKIMTRQELIALGVKNGIMNEADMDTRVKQNAVEISMLILKDLQDLEVLDRTTLITSYIEKWSREAEQEWFESDANVYGEYYDFIDAFAERKLKEFRQEFGFDPKPEPAKKAKLVTFEVTTRVIVNESAMPEVEEEDAIQKAIEKITSNPDGYLCYDNLSWIEDDKECPYNPETDNK